MRIFITGISGFLGRHLVSFLENQGHFVMGVDINLETIKYLRRLHPKISIIEGSICDLDTLKEIRYQMLKNGITHVVHAAANKYIEQNEESPYDAINVNVMGSANIAQLCQEVGIKRLIALSTDKAVDPSCLYGHTKLLMEQMMTVMGYTSYQGVNFFASDGSVIPIWYNQFLNSQCLTVRNLDCIRYFTPVNDVVVDIYKLLVQEEVPSNLCLPSHAFSVSLHDLLDAFMIHFKYTDFILSEVLSYEKIHEDINSKIEILPSTVEIIRSWLHDLNVDELLCKLGDS